MKKFKLFCFILIFVFCCICSCEKEIALNREEFPMIYSFYNCGDTSLQKVVLYCTTIYPEENQTSWVSLGKWRDPYFYDKQNLLYDFDSIVTISDLLAYKGCVYEFDIALHFINESGSGIVKIFSKADTIKNKNYPKIQFRWPEDSLKFNRIEL